MRVSKGVLKAMAMCSGDTYRLNAGVLVEGSEMIATDGRILARCDLGEKAETEGFIPIDGVAGVIRALGARESAELNSTLAAPNGATAGFGENTFPKEWRRALPEETAEWTSVTVSAAYLERLAKTAKALKGREVAVELRIPKARPRANGEGTAMVRDAIAFSVRCSGLSGVLMPIVVD